MSLVRLLRRLLLPALLLLLGGAFNPASAQLGGLGGKLGKLGGAGEVVGRVAGKLNIDGVIRGDAPITTSLPDARWAVDSLDNFTPREAMRSMMQLQRTPNGGFVLQPGYYELHSQSYCLKAGTYGPGGGNGYIFAPPKGPAEDAVMSIVRNSVNQPQIPQSEIQVLLWAIIARAKFEDLQPNMKATASKLLTPRQLAALNRSALDVIPGRALDDAIANMPPLVKRVLQAEAEIRRMVATPTTSFADLERVAVLAGMPEIGAGSRDIPPGRWSLHPDGYYVRYLPRSYNYTVIQLWTPQGSPAVGKEFDPATHIAVPGNTARQRLIQSGRAQQ